MFFWEGNGYAAQGAFPEEFAFGGDQVTTESYDPEGAKAVLEEAGWTDSDGDGIREKDGEKLTIRWLTYPSRQELPLLAEAVQATLKDIGMDVEVNSTAGSQYDCEGSYRMGCIRQRAGGLPDRRSGIFLYRMLPGQLYEE